LRWLSQCEQAREKRIRILLADDHRMVRQGFKLILESQEDMEVVGEPGTAGKPSRKRLHSGPTLS